jgi:hypothetical protein
MRLIHVHCELLSPDRQNRISGQRTKAGATTFVTVSISALLNNDAHKRLEPSLEGAEDSFVVG